VAGRVANPRGALSRRPWACPAITRIVDRDRRRRRSRLDR